MDLRKVVRGVGKTLIALGVLIFLFVAYELWGTGIAEARDQKALKKQFEKQLQAAPPTIPGSEAPEAPPVTVADPGDAIGLIEIPKIGVTKAIVEGVGTEDLKKAPGHYPGTPLPGQAGNAAIAGHRTTYGAPFSSLDELNPGDPINVTTTEGKFRYEVDHTDIVSPSEVSVLEPTEDNRLTLTTCNPKFSAAQRLIVVARLAGPTKDPPPAPAPAVPAPTLNTAGLSGVSSSNGPALLWGLLAGLIWLAAWAVGQSWKKWPAYAIATPFFLVVLFVFFENVSRLLPANV
ncbi:MAG TPA: class E sortase [Acidimicrobiales bacterium]|nr:class E sortase [Acidimicrobiales bacterium]